MSEAQSSSSIESAMQEHRLFPPPPAFAERAHVKSMDQYHKMYRESVEHPEEFWGKAAEALHWFRRWDKVLEWNKHDGFAIPNWAWHEHINRSKTEEAILFSVNDIPIVEAFNLYREEPENSLHTTQAPQVPGIGR